MTVLYHIACSDVIPSFPDDPSEELSSFLSSCLQRDLTKRPDVSSLLLFPFVSQGLGRALGSMQGAATVRASANALL